ncbi:MAG: hypothetical protein JNL69_05745 [Bacteroidia bacterium]|nr:hypothetical protein [Bacteroidia bacterium]
MKKLFYLPFLFIGIAACTKQNGTDCTKPIQLKTNPVKDEKKTFHSMEFLINVPWAEPRFVEKKDNC